jgi:hypothetical protein
MEEVVDIVDELQEWIENHDDLSSVPIANCTYSPIMFSISIGHIEVYNSEMDVDEECTFEYCREQYIQEIDNLYRIRP